MESSYTPKIERDEGHNFMKAKGTTNQSVKAEEQTFGQYVRSLRNEKDWTQSELCERAEIKFTYLSKIENDRTSSVSENVLVRLALALHENPYRLLIRAGKVPTDFQNVILSDEESFQYLETKVHKQMNR
jgi:transcriptional regulator with XRE-family HTH domain